MQSWSPIHDGMIVDIQIEKGEALEQDLSERITTNQSLDVDINAKVTVSSKAFLKSVEKTLTP